MLRPTTASAKHCSSKEVPAKPSSISKPQRALIPPKHTATINLLAPTSVRAAPRRPEKNSSSPMNWKPGRTPVLPTRRRTPLEESSAASCIRASGGNRQFSDRPKPPEREGNHSSLYGRQEFRRYHLPPQFRSGK